MPRRRAIALIKDGLIGNYREVIELGFTTKFVENVDLDFLGGILKGRSKITHAIKPSPTSPPTGRPSTARNQVRPFQPALLALS